MSFSQSLMGGLSFVNSMRGLYNDTKLRGGLEDIRNEKVEEINSKRPATAAEKAKLVDPNTEQNKMLAEQQAEFGGFDPRQYVPEDPQVSGVSGYKYRDKITPYRPDAGLMRADQAMRRADLHEQYGDDPERAMFLRQGAETYRAKEIERLTGEAFKSGSLEALNNAYSQVNDGVASGVEWGPNGEVSIYTWPDNDPTKRSLLMSAPDERTALAQLQKQIDPDMFLRLAGAEQNLAQGQLSMDNTRSLMSERGLDRQDANFTQQYKLAADQLELAMKSGDPRVIAQADALLRQVAGSRLAGGSAGGLGQGQGGGDESGGPPAWLDASESGGKWNAENDAMGAGGMRGHYGRGQFGHARLQEASKALGVQFTPDEFMRNRDLQRQVWAWHENDIKQHIQDKGYDTSGGLKVLGTPMTPGAMLGVAHLGGKRGLDRFIESGGAYNVADRNGTRLSDYARKGYTGEMSSPRGAATPAGGAGSTAYIDGLSKYGRKADPNASRVSRFDPAAVYKDSEEWAMANAPKGADASVIEGLAMDRFKKIQALYAQMTQGLRGGSAAAGPTDEVGAAMKPPSAAKPEPAKAKTAAEAAAAATAGIGKRAEAAATTKETAATKKAQQVALDRVREVEGGVKLLSNIRDPALARSKATSHRAAILKDYEALSVEGQKQADGMLAKIADLFPDLR